MSPLAQAFDNPDPSVRLQAALAVGITPSPLNLETLINQCAIEPDFQVREMLTWALLRLPRQLVLPRVIAELSRPEAQARSQALHTLSKSADVTAWPVVAARLDDIDQEVVRTAWYAAVALVPESERAWLAEKLAARLGGGTPSLQLSLSRALIGLGQDIIAPVLAAAAHRDDPAIRQHAAATERLLDDPALAFVQSREQAHHEVAMGRTRSAKG